MAAVRHSLQKDIFEPSGEKLLVFCEVNKLLKKKTTYFLCLAAGAGSLDSVNLCQVKKVDKNNFKKKRSWILSEIKIVDGGTESNVLALDITADKCYRWVSCNDRDRRQFVTMFAQLVKQYGQAVQFTHFPDTWINAQDMTEIVEAAAHTPLILEPEDPTTLGDLDEENLAALLGGCDLAVEDAESFMRRLGDELLILDGQNVASVLASSTRVDALADKIEQAIAYADALDSRLERYDELLRHVRDAVDKMEERNGCIETSNKNGRSLLSHLYTLIDWLDVSHVPAEVSLATAEDRSAALEVAKSLKSALTFKPEPYMLKLGAVQQQVKLLRKRKDKLVQAVSRHVNNLCIHLSNDASSELPLETLSLRSRENIHKELMPFAPLVHFIKDMDDDKSFVALRKVYTGNMAKLYERDLRNLFDIAQRAISNSTGNGGRDKKSRQSAESREDLLTNGAEYVVETVLNEVERLCSCEEEFCSQFFLLESPKNTESAETDSTGSDKRPAISEETKQVMSDMFPRLEQDLLALVTHTDKSDAYGALRCVARVGGQVLASSAPRSWASRVAATALVAAKRAADKTINDRLNALHAQAKLTHKRTKCGLLPYLNDFEDFCTTAETIFSRSGRRAELERWYLTLANGIIQAIATHEHPRTPHQVIKMENYHHLYDILSKLKLPSLETLRKDVKARYNDALKAYVTQYFGRPLEKLNQFFEDVSARVAAGVREDEVLFQADLSKHQLRKVLALYSKKEVRRGLDQLYKTLEKHLSDEENLLQVVWRAMQEEFIAQYVYLEARIEACYPGACINLSFTMQDILDTFSEIAQEH